MMDNIPEEEIPTIHTPVDTPSSNARTNLSTINNSSTKSIVKGTNQIPHSKINSSTRSVNSTNSSPSTKSKIFQSPTRKPPPTPTKKLKLLNIFPRFVHDQNKSNKSLQSTHKSKHKKRSYEAPTEFHKYCKSGFSIKDIISRFKSKSTNNLSDSSQVPDNDERLLLHLFSMNKHLSNLDNSQNSDIFQKAELTSAPMDSTDDRPLEIQFLLDYLVKSNPTAICCKDKKGYIPFQYSIIEWITEESFKYSSHHHHAHTIPSNLHSDVNTVPYSISDGVISPRTMKEFFTNVIVKVQKTKSAFSHTSNASIQDPPSTPANATVPNNSRSGSPKNDSDSDTDDGSNNSTDNYDTDDTDNQNEKENNQSNEDNFFPKNVCVTPHFVFVLLMLSAIIEDLEKKSREEKTKMNNPHSTDDTKKNESSNEPKVAVGSIDELPKKSFIQRTRGSSFRKKRKTIDAPSTNTNDLKTYLAEKKMKIKKDSDNPSISTTVPNSISLNQNLTNDFPTSKSIKNHIIQTIASIPNIIKTLLLIENDQDRNFLFNLPIIREIIFHKDSIGKWLVFMLRSHDRGISKRAVNYLKLISGENDDISNFRFHNQSYENIGGDIDNIDDGFSMINEKSNKRLTEEEEGTRDELYEVFSQLDGLIPSLLGLDEKMIEQAATTKIISRVLDKMVLKPFAISILFLDLLLLILLIASTRNCVNRYLHLDSPEISNWSIVSSVCALYFVIRELGKVISLWSFTGSSFFDFNYLFNFWNIVDVFSIILAATSNFLIRLFVSGKTILNFSENDLRIIFALTMGLLWLRVLGLLKTINMHLATFVLAIIQITRDILWFLLILLVIIVSFAQMFDILLCKEGNGRCGGWDYYFRVYSILLGDYGEFEREDFNTDLSMFLAVLFTFMVVIVLLNVLIAIVSDSYEKCLLRSEYLFGRARVMLLAELVSFQNLLQPRQEQTNDKNKNINGECCTRIKFFVWKSRDKKSFIFIALSSTIIVVLVVAENWLKVSGFFSTQAQSATFILSTILFTLFIFCVLIYLSSLSSVHPIITSSIQTLMFRFVRTSADAEHVTDEKEEWKGQLKFLKREMSRIAFETTKHTERLIQHESRLMNTKRGQLERRIVESEKRIMNQLKETQLQLENLSKQLSISNVNKY